VTDHAAPLRIGSVQERVARLLVASEAELAGRGYEIDERGAFRAGYDMTGRTSHGESGVHMLAFAFVSVTPDAFG